MIERLTQGIQTSAQELDMNIVHEHTISAHSKLTRLVAALDELDTEMTAVNQDLQVGLHCIMNAQELSESATTTLRGVVSPENLATQGIYKAVDDARFSVVQAMLQTSSATGPLELHSVHPLETKTTLSVVEGLVRSLPEAAAETQAYLVQGQDAANAYLGGIA